MEMTDRNRQCIRGVVWRGHALEREQQAHHLLHLMFLGVAVTNNRLLYQARRILTNLEPRSFRNQQHNTAHLAQLHRDFDIRREERVFNRTRIGKMFSNYFLEGVAHFQKTRRKLQTRRHANRSKRDE